MTRSAAPLLLISLAFSACGGAPLVGEEASPTASGRIIENPIIRVRFSSDQAARAHDGRVWHYTGHDVAGPKGPFVDARGSALVSNDMTDGPNGMDWDDLAPTVFIDANRQARMQRVQWADDGTPVFGEPVPDGPYVFSEPSEE